MKTRIWAALITVYIVWGSTYLAIRFAVESMPPFLMAATRFLIAGAVLFGWRWLAGDRRPKQIEWRSAAIVGLLLLTGGNGNVVWAEQHVASGVAALIVGSAPLWMVAIDAFRPGGKKANLQTWVGVMIGFVGILILISPWEMARNPQSMDVLGILSLLLGAFLWTVGISLQPWRAASRFAAFRNQHGNVGRRIGLAFIRDIHWRMVSSGSVRDNDALVVGISLPDRFRCVGGLLSVHLVAA